MPIDDPPHPPEHPSNAEWLAPPADDDPRDWRARAPRCVCGEGLLPPWHDRCEACARLAGRLIVNGVPDPDPDVTW